MQIINTTKEVVLLLGGTARLAKLLGCTPSNVSMWMASGRIPAKWVEVVRYHCYRRDHWVESSVFGLPDIDYSSALDGALVPSSPATASSGEGTVTAVQSSSLENLSGASALAPFPRGG
jgi:hypothetical protein